MAELNLISVKESASRELTADGAEIVVRIAGQSFVTGQEAFKKAKEVADFTASLTQLGVAEDDISLVNVLTEVESGLLTKSSSATYILRVKLTTLESIGPTLAAISSQKNATTDSITWRFSALEDAKRDVLQQAVRNAKASAEQIAQALGTTLAGVHRLSYDSSGIDGVTRPPSAFGKARRTRKLEQAETELSQMSLTHTARLTVSTSADFLVAGS
ncbi:SIMPL domain-containing protein [Aeoliella sp. ICT_H6.2]|uniref:SIMPL domain-containing protein n=1 Tax=Aeoliella straminimaris TaxID=2954799 RepID=A0A9X2FI44_9BACT|nr:SIMPL domain-containing protein [Aeoliella straminimaris]MCO6046761.1 SIMPL domain-containing protein [Aeoliella straminimaris]